MAKAKTSALTPIQALPDQGNLLTEALIGVADLHGQRTRLTLPQVLARLADISASTIAFTGLQAHQAHAWHAFLVQLAAMVIPRAGVVELPTNPVWWCERLRELGGGEAAWTLVVGDLAQPGFMQPPVPEGRTDHFTMELPAPGSIDTVLLIPAKNHDVKTGAGLSSQFENWMMSLVSTQTQMGYVIQYNGGIFRMNQGNGNRPGIGTVSSFDLGRHFRRDYKTLMETRASVLDRRIFAETGVTLAWLRPWDGTNSLSLSELDPWCIECARRIRLVGNPIRAFLNKHSAPCIETQKALTGNVGDPWTPIGKASRNLGKSLTLPSAGFTYQRVVELLMATEWEAPPAQTIRADDAGDLRWYGRALVRGQGKTEGWHEREVPIDPKMRSRFTRPVERDRLAATAKTMIELAGVMRLGILKPALRTLWEDAAGRIDGALQRLEQQVDAAFFPHLWEHPDSDEAWRSRLRDLALAILEEDLAALGPNADRWKRICGATSRFDFLLGRKSHPKTGIFLPPPSPKATTA